MRRLPLHVVPTEDEAFASYADRVAVDYQIPLGVLLQVTGVQPKGVMRYPPGYGVVLLPAAVASFAWATALTPERVSKMLLGHRYDGIAFDFPDVALSQRSMRGRSQSMWALWAASRLCPSCITELGGVWHIGWKLAWSFACVRHQRLLIDSCPTCHQTLGARRTRSRPLFFGRIPTPGFCMNSAATLGQRSGYRSPMCGTPLGELESVELAHVSPIIAAQRQIDTVLNRGPAVALKGEIRPLDYFQSLKRICAMILLSASPCDLGDLPRSVLGAFEQHVAERERSIRRVGSEGRRVAFHLNAPRSPELMAAVASLAVRIRADVPSEVLTKRPQRMNRLQFERDRWPLVREYLR